MSRFSGTISYLCMAVIAMFIFWCSDRSPEPTSVGALICKIFIIMMLGLIWPLSIPLHLFIYSFEIPLK